MELWEWGVLALGAAVVTGSWVWWLAQRTRRSREILGLSQRERLELARWMLNDPASPAAARPLVALLMAYLALPLDLIPDFIPVVGHLDDLAVTMAVVTVIVWMMPAERIDVGIAAARMHTIRAEQAETAGTGGSGKARAGGLVARAGSVVATGLVARRLSRTLRRR